MYMMETARIINSAKKNAIVDGVKYERNNEEYEQSLFLTDELSSYTTNALKVNDNRSLYLSYYLWFQSRKRVCNWMWEGWER